MPSFPSFTGLRAQGARMQTLAQTRVAALGATPRGRLWLAVIPAVWALALGALMAGLILHGGRSTLFVVTACLSLPALFVLPDAAKKRFMLLALGAALLLGGLTTPSFKGYDAVGNVNLSYNILVNSIYTVDDPLTVPAREMTYSSHREPLFSVTLVPLVALALHDLADVPGLPDLADKLEALYIHPYLKAAPLLWTAALLLGLWKMGTFNNKHYIAVWLSLAFTFVYFCREDLGEMRTEIAAAALLAWLVWASLKALETGRTRWLLLLGVLGACLALVKLLFLYVFALGTPFLALALYWRGERRAGEALRFCLASLLGFAGGMGLYCLLVIGTHPGVGVRDILHSGRGDGVLATRALKNAMTPDERLGTLYAYSRGVAHELAGFLLDADEKDIRRGGRWERLSRGSDRIVGGGHEKLPPEESVSYYQRSRDPKLQAGAKERILDNVGLHLAMTPIFLYRGLFGLATGSTGLALFLYCAWMFAASLIKRRPYDLVALWYPLALLGAYALSSHFIPRYAEPIGPVLQTFFCVHMAMLLRNYSTGEEPGGPGEEPNSTGEEPA